MKEKVFMVAVLIFLFSCGEVSDNNNGNNNNNNYGLGLYNAPILMGDIKEKPAKDVYVTGQGIDSSSPTVELKPNTSTIVTGELSPISVKNASTFEVVSAMSDNLNIITNCHTGLPSNNCMSTFTYHPNCSGKVFSQVRLRADIGGPKTINVIGNTSDFINKCEKNIADNVTMKLSSNNHRFNNINEIFYFTIEIDKPTKNGYKYSVNGAVNGFYYSYECYHSKNQQCNGFIQLLGKIGKYDCKGEAELKLNIKADYFNGKEAEAKTITVKGFGIGRDDNYTCM